MDSECLPFSSMKTPRTHKPEKNKKVKTKQVRVDYAHFLIHTNDLSVLFHTYRSPWKGVPYNETCPELTGMFSGILCKYIKEYVHLYLYTDYAITWR